MVYSYAGKKLKKAGLTKSQREETPRRELQLPNSTVMRIMQHPAAEKEADRLSENLSAVTPNELRQEMGARLDADLSPVRFHNDNASEQKARAIGARAFTSGRDIYFGRNGFDPSVAAHELVHTVQQGAVRGNTAQPVSYGSVQMKPEDEDEDGQKQQSLQNAKPEELQQAILTSFQSGYGRKVFSNIETPLKVMIKKGAGKKIANYNQNTAVKFMVDSAEQVYTAKELLRETAENPLASTMDARLRTKEYKYIIDYISSKIGLYGLEQLAIDNDMKTGKMKFKHNKSGPGRKKNARAYEMESGENLKNGEAFNPEENPEITQIQKEIDDAGSVKEAYKKFALFCGNPEAKYIDAYNTQIKPELFKAKLKHMVRVVYDYPELKGNIGNMTILDKNHKDKMNTTGTAGGIVKARFEYNGWVDSDEGEKLRSEKSKAMEEDGESTGRWNTVGTHEMGHVLSSLLITEGSGMDRVRQWNTHVIDDDILKTVLSDESVMQKDEFKNLKYHKDAGENSVGEWLPGQIDTVASNLGSKTKQQYTSTYGSKSAAEFVAEAFHDVYANGKKARKASVAAVKEYEKRQKKIQRDKFKKGTKKSMWDSIMSFFGIA